MTSATTRTIHLRSDLSDLPVTIAEVGSGRTALVLHGGGGPFTVQSIATHLSGTMRVITPTHPGWNGSERPAWLTSVADLARAYLQLLQQEGLRDVVVIGSSMGGWIACEMALRDEGGRITGLVLIDTGGVEIEGQPMRDFFALDARGVAEYAYHDADRFYIDSATLSAQQVATQRANMAALRLFAGDPYMHDPTLLSRLGRIQVPTLVLWGDSDRIITPAYGRAFAGALANARFTLVSDAGHLPHIEQPGPTFAALDAYLQSGA
jgi:pimeloyl-ACP methyl ester carboxylesterase